MGPGVFFPTNPDLADILGRTDFYFEIFFVTFWIPNSQISRSADFQVPRNLAWARLGLGLGWAWAGLGRAWALGRVLVGPRVGRVGCL